MHSSLPVVECFHSIQGEGAHTGRSAFFIRLASCKVGCSWCDTKESWNSDNHPKRSIKDLATHAIRAAKTGASFIVLTGGEPLHHNLNELTLAIRSEAYSNKIGTLPIHLETSGVNQISGSPNWITLSPKRHAPPCIQVIKAANELKVVIHDQEDLYFAEEMAQKMNEIKQIQPKLHFSVHDHLLEPFLYLQPGWQNSKGQSLSIKHVQQNPQWRLSMQTHKWLGMQ